MNKIILILILLMNCSTEREGDKKKRIQKECRNSFLALTIYGNTSIEAICKNVNSRTRKTKTEDECFAELRQSLLIFTFSSAENCFRETSNDYKINPP